MSIEGIVEVAEETASAAVVTDGVGVAGGRAAEATVEEGTGVGVGVVEAKRTDIAAARGENEAPSGRRTFEV